MGKQGMYWMGLRPLHDTVVVVVMIIRDLRLSGCEAVSVGEVCRGFIDHTLAKVTLCRAGRGKQLPNTA